MINYTKTVNLVPGENSIVVNVPGGSIEQISFKATCAAQLKQFYHGQKNLLLEDQEPIDINAIPEGWGLQSKPGEEFQDGIHTLLVIQAEAPGELTAIFQEKAS